MSRRLYRDGNNKMLYGVCSGLAGYFGLDPTLVRLGLVVLGFAQPVFAVVGYVGAVIVVPESSGGVINPTGSSEPRQSLGLVLIALGGLLLFANIGWPAMRLWFPILTQIRKLIWPLFFVTIGLLVILSGRRRD